MNILMRFHRWCMRQATRHDRPGYSWRAFAFDWIGGRAAELATVLRSGGVAVICAIGFCVAVPLSLESCNPINVPANAIAAAQVAAQTAATVVNDAEAAWPIVKALLPTDSQASAQAAFDRAVFTANHAILVLNDAIKAAIAANTPNPDFSALLSSLSDAVAQIVAVIDNFKGQNAAALDRARTTSGVDVFEDMRGAAARLKSSASASAPVAPSPSSSK